MSGGPSFKSRRPASARASKAARAGSRKTATRCEMLLRRRLFASGCRYRVDASDLPGRPDIVFPRARLVIFCDGDFWHGKNWPERRLKLAEGHNADYWIPKIERNMARDLVVSRELRDAGWIVLRFWESEIRHDLDAVCEPILAILDSTGHRRRPSGGNP